MGEAGVRIPDPDWACGQIGTAMVFETIDYRFESYHARMTVMTSDLIAVSQDHHEGDLEDIPQEGKTTGDI